VIWISWMKLITLSHNSSKDSWKRINGKRRLKSKCIQTLWANISNTKHSVKIKMIRTQPSETPLIRQGHLEVSIAVLTRKIVAHYQCYQKVKLILIWKNKSCRRLKASWNLLLRNYRRSVMTQVATAMILLLWMNLKLVQTHQSNF